MGAVLRRDSFVGSGFFGIPASEGAGSLRRPSCEGGKTGRVTTVPPFRLPARIARFALLLPLLCMTLATAADREILGSHEGWLDRMGAGVRELGRGNTGTALLDAAPGAYWNPAALAFHRRTQAAMGAEVRSLGRTGGYLSMQGPVANNLGLGVAVVNRGDWGVTAYDENEASIGTARPQAFATWFAAGARTSRRNAFGAALQLYASSLDVGEGVGDVNFVGGLNLGWYRRLTDSIDVAVVVRNLGFNGRLSAQFEQVVTGDDVGFGYTSSARDFFPKTIVVAAEWRKRLWDRQWAFSAEAMDYQLKDVLFTPNPAFHSQALRLGAECEVAERTHLRAGLDRLNPTFGIGYAYRWSRARVITFDYALVMERGITTFNPYAVGVKTNF